MKFFVTSSPPVIPLAGIIFTLFSSVRAQGVTSQEEEGQKFNTPERKDDVLVRLLKDVGHTSPSSLHLQGGSGAGKQSKQSKQGKTSCACEVNLDYGGVCENQPFIYFFSPKYSQLVCQRFQNSLMGDDEDDIFEIGFPGYINLYDRCVRDYAGNGEPMENPNIFKTAEECYNAKYDPLYGDIKIVDDCIPSSHRSTPAINITTNEAGEVNKMREECKLNINNCTRTCGQDKTAYYLTTDNKYFGFRNDGLTSEYPALLGGCHHFLQDEFAMISYNRCIENETEELGEKYKSLDACCKAKGGCNEFWTNSSAAAVWRIDQCNKTIPPKPPKNESSSEIVDNTSEFSHQQVTCHTFQTCEQCIHDLSALVPGRTDGEVGEKGSVFDIKYLFDYIVSQTGESRVAAPVTSVGADSESGTITNVGECKPCIDHLLAKFTTPAFLLDKVEDTPQSFWNSFFSNLLDEVAALKRVSGIDLMHLYDYLMSYYSDEFLTTHDSPGPVRRMTAKRAINFKTGC